MDCAEAALRVAEHAIAEIQRLAAEIERLRAAPSGAVSFLIDAEGRLIGIRSNGAKEIIGRVRGNDGSTGSQGERGPDGRDGRDGKDGSAGRSIVKASIDDQDRLVLTMTDGSEEIVGSVVGRAGMPGRDGIDGKDGPRGLDGSNGRDGAPGIDGQPGPRGVRGESPPPPAVEFSEPEEIELDADQMRRLRVQRVNIAGVEMTLLTLSDD